MPSRNLLIPPRKMRKAEGAFAWPERPVIAGHMEADLLPMKQLADDLRRLGMRPRIERNAYGSADARLSRTRILHGREAYRLNIGPDGIVIDSGGEAGAYYAIQTLRDLLAIHGRKLPACRIEDWPYFVRRGIYHDCSRGKVPKIDTLKDLVERLAHWKINELQLYVENVFTWRRHPTIGRGCSPFTPQELLELQDHCNRHHVRLVGSLASFGHMERIVSMPEYRHLGEGRKDPLFPYGATLCPTDPKSIRFMEELYEEFVPLFEPVDFNICCDETWELGQGRSKRAAQRRGVPNLYLDFVKKLCDLIRGHGKRPNLWADIALQHPEMVTDIPADAVLLNWDYDPKGKRIPKTRDLRAANLAVMVCPSTKSCGSHGSRLGSSMANIRRFASVGRRYGAEGVLNTDWGDDGHRNTLGVSLHGFAHGAAHGWNGAGVKEDDFTERFCRLTFGDTDGRIAKGLRALGRLDASGERSNEQSILYHALVERIRHPKNEEYWPWGWWFQDWASKADPEGLERTVEKLSSASLFPSAGKEMPPFEALALREYSLAAWMDVVSARRALAVRAIRAGDPPPARELRKLADDMHRVAEDFSKLWLKRNKPSQLRDNMKHLRRAEREIREAGKKRI